MFTLQPAVIQALQEAKLVQKHDRLCDLAAIDAIPTEVLNLLKLDIQIAIARQSVTAERILVALAGSEYKEVRLAVLKNPNISAAVLNILRKDQDRQIGKLVQVHPNNSTAGHFPNDPESLRQLSQHNDWRVRSKVARNPATPVDVLAVLAEDPFNNGSQSTHFVRQAVAENPATPVDILRKLASDASCSYSVGCNLNTPVDLLEELAGMNDRAALWGMLKHPLTPVHILVKIPKLCSIDSQILEDLAKHPNTPSELLDTLSNYDADLLSSRVRIAVAENPNTSADILANLSTDPYKQIWTACDYHRYAHFLVQIAVASNPNTPVCILESFYQQKDIFICSGLAKNTKLPIHLLRTLAVKDDYTLYDYPGYQSDNFNVKPILSSPLKEIYLNNIKRYLAENTSTPTDLLEILSNYREYYVRLGVAQNKTTPIAILEKLSHSKARGVREAAQTHLRSIYRELASQPETSTEQLQEMLQHRDIEIRLAATLHPQGLNLLLERCLQLENSLSRFLAALHPQISSQQRGV